MPRRLYLLLAFLAVATLVSSPAVVAQSREGDLSDLWKQYPLETRDEQSPLETRDEQSPLETRDEQRRPVGAAEEDGSTAGPPPKPAEPVGPIPLALLFIALAVGLIGVAGGALQAVAKLRQRRRDGPAQLGEGARHFGG